MMSSKLLVKRGFKNYGKYIPAGTVIDATDVRFLRTKCFNGNLLPFVASPTSNDIQSSSNSDSAVDVPPSIADAVPPTRQDTSSVTPVIKVTPVTLKPATAKNAVLITAKK